MYSLTTRCSRSSGDSVMAAAIGAASASSRVSLNPFEGAGSHASGCSGLVDRATAASATKPISASGIRVADSARVAIADRLFMVDFPHYLDRAGPQGFPIISMSFRLGAAPLG